MERVTGLAYRDLMRRYVLDPLGMADTGLDTPHVINPGRAYGHEMKDGKLFNAENDRLSEFEGPGELTQRCATSRSGAMRSLPLPSSRYRPWPGYSHPMQRHSHPTTMGMGGLSRHAIVCTVVAQRAFFLT